jgi:hypothetical protein
MQRLVLMPDAPFSAVEAAARGLGWHAVVPSGEDDDDVRMDFMADYGVRARCVDDSLSGWTYLLVPDAHADEWRDALAPGKLLVSRDEALAMFRAARDPELLIQATLLLGLFAHGPFDEDVFASIAAALLADSEEVRGAALTAITYSSWDRFSPLLREGLKESSASPTLLADAREIAERMEAEDWHRSYYATDP